MTEMLWALLVIFICILVTYLAVGMLCVSGAVDKCLPLVALYLI